MKEINGRGGTNFQCIFDYYFLHKKEYSGMIVFTDGDGNKPFLNEPCSNVLWILENRLSFEKNKGWITSLNGNKATFLPV